MLANVIRLVVLMACAAVLRRWRARHRTPGGGAALRRTFRGRVRDIITARSEGGCHVQEDGAPLASQEHPQYSFVRFSRLRSFESGLRSLRRSQAVQGVGRKAKALGRLSFVAQLVLFSSLSPATPAFAQMGGWYTCIYGPVEYTWDGVTYYQTGVVAGNQFDAALVAMGDWSKKIQITSEMFAKLSNESTGGAFYELAMLFENPPVDSFSTGRTPGGVSSWGVAPGFWATCYALYGEGNVWLAEYTSTQLASAKEDLQVILDGGSLGGGGGNEGNGFVLDGIGLYYNSRNLIEPLQTTLVLGQYAQGIYDEYKSSYNKLYCIMTCQNNDQSNTSYDIYLIMSDQNLTLTKEKTTDYINIYGDNGWTKSYYYSCKLIAPANTHIMMAHDNSSWNWTSNCRTTINLNTTFSTSTYTNGGNIIDYTYTAILDNCSSASTPVVPPNNWPDDTVAPTSPELPEPTTPTVDTPTAPTGGGDMYVYNTYNYPSNTTPQDYTPWLESIDRHITGGIEQICDQLNEHCNHLQDKMAEVGGYIADTITDNFEAYYQDFTDYLRDLFQWLGDTLDFDYSGYNDSSVVYWLKRIWSRLGGATPSPVSHPDDAWKWLDDLINNILNGLIDGASGLVSDVASLISGIISKFPFSIPWDIAAVLTSLVGVPVTPHVEFPLRAAPLGINTTVVIDLSAFNQTMEIVRAMELISFGCYLLWLSRDMIDMIDWSEVFS